MLDESNIPQDMLPRARKWYDSQVQRLKAVHGKQWSETGEWLEDYLNAEVRELVWKEVAKDAI